MSGTTRCLQRTAPSFFELDLLAASLTAQWPITPKLLSSRPGRSAGLLPTARPSCPPAPRAADVFITTGQGGISADGVDQLHGHLPSFFVVPSMSWLGLGRRQMKSVGRNISRHLSIISLPRIWARLRGRHADVAEHQHDENKNMAAWAYRLGQARQQFGDDGVFLIFDVVRHDKTLHAVSGPFAHYFWGTILRAAVWRAEKAEQVVDHALWMLDCHGKLWPDLYMTLLNTLLERNRLQEARKYHDLFTIGFSRDSSPSGVTKEKSGVDKDLPPSYAPSAMDLAALLQRFILNPSHAMQDTLMYIYTTQSHRRMYDQLIPPLFLNGMSQQAREWRRLLTSHGDRPVGRISSPSRPFLRYLHGYYRQTYFFPEELSVIGLEGEYDESEAEGSSSRGNGASHELFLSGMGMGLPRLAMPSEASHDMRCARYFATKHLTYASIVVTLQITELGPLAMQAIARREENAAAVARTLVELERFGVSVASSAYGLFIEYLAKKGQDGLLSDLLQRDIHPDEFDKVESLHRIINDAVARGDLRRYRLLVAVQLAGSTRLADATLNHVLGHTAIQGSARAVAELVDDMTALDVRVSRSKIKPLVFQHHLHFAARSWEALKDDVPLLQDIIRISRRMGDMGWRPNTGTWQGLLYRLGRLRRLDDLERVCMHVVDTYERTEPGTRLVAVNKRDTNTPEHYLVEGLAYLPLDAPTNHPSHPLRWIFTPELIRAIVRWGLVYALNTPPPHTTADQRTRPRDWGVARGVRLVRDLVRTRGVAIPHAEEIVRDALAKQLTALRLGRIDARRWDTPAAIQAVNLFNEAWGSRLLPATMAELDALVVPLAQKRVMRERKRTEERVKRGNGLGHEALVPNRLRVWRQSQDHSRGVQVGRHNRMPSIHHHR